VLDLEAKNSWYVAFFLIKFNFKVLCTLKKSKSELASYQEKIFKVDDHIGMAISGLTADASILSIKSWLTYIRSYLQIYEK